MNLAKMDGAKNEEVYVVVKKWSRKEFSAKLRKY